jgi:hypothetical protein
MREKEDSLTLPRPCRRSPWNISIVLAGNQMWTPNTRSFAHIDQVRPKGAELPALAIT